MADPDMQVRIFPEIKIAEALTFQQDSALLPIYQQVYIEINGQLHVNCALKNKLNVILLQWLKNIQDQKYINEVTV